MKLSRRGKSARRGRHTKRAGKHLRYKGKKVRASKRYHRAHKRTYKRGRRVHRGGVPPGKPSEFSLPLPGAFELPQTPQELPTLVPGVPGQFKKTLHLYYTKTSDVGSRFSVDDKDFEIVGKYLNPEFIRSTTNHPNFLLTMTRLGDAAGKTVSFTITLTVEYTVVDASSPEITRPEITRRYIGDIIANRITYKDSKGAERTFYAQPGGCKGLLQVMSGQGSIYDFPTGSGGGVAYIMNGPNLMEIVNSIEKQIKIRLAETDVTTRPVGRVVISPDASLPDASGQQDEDDTVLPRRRVLPPSPTEWV